MIIKTFKTNRPVLYVLLSLMTVAFWLPSFIYSEPQNIVHKGPLFSTLEMLIAFWKPLLPILLLLFLIAQSLYINVVVEKHRLMKKSSFLPGLLYITLVFTFWKEASVHPVVVANTFLVIVVDKLLSLSRSKKINYLCFDVGFLSGLSVLVFPPLVVLIPVAWIALFMFRPFNWREWLITAIGVCLPLMYLYVYYYWNDNTQAILSLFRLSEVAGMNISTSKIILLSFVGIVLTVSFYSFLKELSVNTLRIKNCYFVIIWLLVLSVLSFFIFKLSLPSFALLVSIPLAVYMATYFLRDKKKMLKEIIYFLWLVLIVYDYISMQS